MRAVAAVKASTAVQFGWAEGGGGKRGAAEGEVGSMWLRGSAWKAARPSALSPPMAASPAAVPAASPSAAPSPPAIAPTFGLKRPLEEAENGGPNAFLHPRKRSAFAPADRAE